MLCIVAFAVIVPSVMNRSSLSGVREFHFTAHYLGADHCNVRQQFPELARRQLHHHHQHQKQLRHVVDVSDYRRQNG